MKTTVATARVIRSEQGFSLIELLVTMGIAMVILAGLYYNFFLQARVQESQSTSVGALQDLRLASNIMAGQLRLAVNICSDTTNGLVYQPLQSTVTMTSCSGAVAQSWGQFLYDASQNKLFWKRPGTTTSSELLRGLYSSGMVAQLKSVTGPLWQVTLTGQYQDIGRNTQPLSVTFYVMPRN